MTVNILLSLKTLWNLLAEGKLQVSHCSKPHSPHRVLQDCFLTEKLFSHRGQCHFCGGTQRLSLLSTFRQDLHNIIWGELSRITECPACPAIFHICMQLCCLGTFHKCIGVSAYSGVFVCLPIYLAQTECICLKETTGYLLWQHSSNDIELRQTYLWNNHAFVWSFESEMLTWIGKGKALSQHSWSSWE